MRIAVSAVSAEALSVAPPFPFVKKIELIPSNNRENNLIATFVEQCWRHQGGEDYRVNFTPTSSQTLLFVTAQTQDRLDDFVSWTVATLKEGFERQNCQFLVA